MNCCDCQGRFEGVRQPVNISVWVIGNHAVEVLIDHAERSADEVAIAVSKVGVVPSYQSFKAEAPILPKRNLAQQKVAQHIACEQVALGLGALRELLALDLIAERIENRLCAHDVAFALGHLRVIKQQPSVRGDLLGQRQLSGYQERRPVDAVEANDLLAHKM